MKYKKITLIIGTWVILSFVENVNAQLILRDTSFNYVSDTIQTWTIPGCVTQITVKLWGGGGGGGYYYEEPYWAFVGGSGSYYEGVISGLTPGTVLDLYVPSAGKYTTVGPGGAGGWPGGGQGGYDSADFFGRMQGGGGGGYAAIQISGTYYVIAGAGGGGGTHIFDNCYGGGGGATTGGNGAGGGNGGTISMGGASGVSNRSCDSGTSGLAFNGGNGGGLPPPCGGNDYAGGGGGAGYYGGGGGGDSGGGGGGGSSYPASTFSMGGITFTPISNIQGNTGNNLADYQAPGSPPDTIIGMGGYDTNGGNGLIIITYIGGAPLTSTVSAQTNPNCGICNGNTTVIASGGVGAYTYSWQPTGQVTATATGLCAGTYTVTVTDSCGDVATASVLLTAIPIVVNANVTHEVQCNGACNGSASASVVLGTSPYTYNWQPGGESTQTATGLCAGIYTVTVTDKNTCTGTASVTITQPTAITLSDTVSNPLCNGGVGTATVTASGGYGFYKYLWNPTGQTTATASNLTARTYTIMVTDSGGCTATATATLTQPTQVTASINITSNIPCNGETGSATVTATGGVSPYTYLWNPTNQSTAVATGLSARTYSVTVTDNNGCTATGSVTLTQPAVLTATIGNINKIKCNGGVGTATVNGGGGTVPYTYLWTAGNQSTALATGLSVGTYSVTITDKNHCTASSSVTMTQPTTLTSTITSTTNISCFNGGNGAASVRAAGGTAPYTYLWTPSANTDANARGLFAVSYTVTVTDSNGCTATATTTLTQPNQVTVNITEPQIICKDSTGTLAASAAGGTAPYTYTWSTGYTSTNNSVSITPISTIYYTVTVTDKNGCTASNSITLQYGPSFAVNITGKNSVCTGDSTNICANAIGAIYGAKYYWQPVNSNNACIKVAPTNASEVYTVTVVDGCGSTTTASTTIYTEPSPTVNMYANFYQGCEPLCIQFRNSTTISKGGIRQYVWAFGTGDTSFSANPVYCYKNSGGYSVSLTVISDSGCSATLKKIDMLTVYSPPKAAFTYSPQSTTIENPTITFKDESTDASDTNLRGGIVYRIWSFGDESDSTSNLQNPIHTYKDTGTYCASLMVMNAGGCTDTVTNCLIINPAFKLYIPSAFTPNGDGRNEVFKPVGQYIKSFEMYIFDRWGLQLYHSTDMNAGWDGRVNGNIAKEDVYIYKIMVIDSKDNEHSYVGNVTLIK